MDRGSTQSRLYHPRFLYLSLQGLVVLHLRLRLSIFFLLLPTNHSPYISFFVRTPCCHSDTPLSALLCFLSVESRTLRKSTRLA